MRQQSAGAAPGLEQHVRQQTPRSVRKSFALTDGGSHACTADLLIAADAVRRGGEIGQRLTRCVRPDLAGHGSEPFPSWLCLAGLQYVDGLGQLPSAPGAAAELAEDAPGLELGVCPFS